MSEDLDDLVENIKEPSVWIRILFMLAFGVVLYFILAPVIFVIMLAQALFVLLTGESNENLRTFSSALSEYINQTLTFLTYNSDDKPFPFSDFPNIGAGDTGSSGKSSAKKSTGKKKSTRKKSSKKKSGKSNTGSGKENDDEGKSESSS